MDVLDEEGISKESIRVVSNRVITHETERGSEAYTIEECGGVVVMVPLDFRS
jgi:hypothetical protein